MENMTLGNDDEAVKQIKIRVENAIKEYMSKKDIKIDRSKITTTEPKTIQAETRMIPTRKQMSREYEELLKGKVEDEQIKSKVIKYAEIMIQPTTYCKVTMKTNNGEKPILKVICCLPEHAQKMVSFWINKEIDSQQFVKKVKEFELSMKQERIANVIIENVPKGKTKITGVETEFSFV